MASITEGFAFCVLDGAPILRTDSASYRLNPSPSGQRWSRIKKKDARRASKLKSIAFFHKFGVDLPIFPPSLRSHDPRLWLITNDKYFLVEVGKSLNLKSRYAPSQAADVINLDQRRHAKSKFYLGSHSYSAGPGVSWSTEYMIERLDDAGTSWEIYVTEESQDDQFEEDDPFRFQSMGEFSTADAKEYFEGVRFRISDDEWRSMGCRTLSADEEQHCANCGDAYEGDIDAHECNVDRPAC